MEKEGETSGIKRTRGKYGRGETKRGMSEGRGEVENIKVEMKRKRNGQNEDVQVVKLRGSG